MSKVMRLVKQDWTSEQKAEFLRRRRARNYLLLAALCGLCVIIYAVTVVKLHQYGAIF